MRYDVINTFNKRKSFIINMEISAFQLSVKRLLFNMHQRKAETRKIRK